MNTCPETRSCKPWQGLQLAGTAGTFWRHWAAASFLAVPVLASAAPSLSVNIGTFTDGGCLARQITTAASGPLTLNATCNDMSGLRTGQAFATADFGSLGASTFLTLQPPFGSVNTGLARANFVADYVFTGPGSNVAVNLNLDLNGRLAVSNADARFGNHARSSVQITLLVPGGFLSANFSIDEDGNTFLSGNLDDDADFSTLTGAAGGSVAIDSNGFTVPVGVPVTLTLGLQAAGTLGSPAGGGFVTSLSNFGSTLTFNRDGPVFALPAGYTVNGPGVVDNVWVGASVVPEPSPALLAGAGLAALIWLRRRMQRHPADRR